MMQIIKFALFLSAALFFFYAGSIISRIIFSKYFLIQKTDNTTNTQLIFQKNINNLVDLAKPKETTINVWIAGWDGTVALQSLKESDGKIDYASPVFYHLNESGQINETDFKMKSEILTEIDNQNIKLTPLIFNDFDPKRVGAFLDSEYKTTAIQQLVTLSKQYKYSGWDINWEQVSDADQGKFIQFLKQLQDSFKNNDLELIVTVPAKTGDKSDWSGATGYNWKEIAKYADEVRIMAYDYHNQSTKPGAITPNDWYKRVLDYAVDHIPIEKITISLPLYGYRWDANGVFLGSTKNQDSVLSDAKKDEVEGSVRYILNNGDVVWTEDKNTLENKMNTAKEMGIQSFSFWRLGAEPSDFWQDSQN